MQQRINNKMSTVDDIDGVCGEFDVYKRDVEKKISDEELFKQPPPKEDCPICFQLLPNLGKGYKYQTCCGKIICSGCIHAPLFDNQGNKVNNKKCPFCRTPHPKSIEEVLEREKKRVEKNDPYAIFNLGCYYRNGKNGYPQDYTKALELFHRAAELGYAGAYSNISHAYYFGDGVEQDKKKATSYYELGAMGGDSTARHNLGLKEKKAGNTERALIHYMIAVRSGCGKSLEVIKELYTDGNATKEDYSKALRTYQEYLVEIKSVQRDKAAAFNSERYRYY